MADPRLKTLKIKTGVVRRIAKEKVSYEKEAGQQRERIQKLKQEGRDEYDIRKQEEVLQESLMMVPDCQRKLVKAFEELKNILDNEKDLKESEEFLAALKVLEEAKNQLPTPAFPATAMDYYTYQKYTNGSFNNDLQLSQYHCTTNSTTNAQPVYENLNFAYPSNSESFQNYTSGHNYTGYYTAATNSSNGLSTISCMPPHFDPSTNPVLESPPAKYDLSIPSTQLLENKTDDELWIETWLSKIGKIQINLNSTIEINSTQSQRKPQSLLRNSLQLNEVKLSLNKCLKVMDKLQSMHDCLKKNADTMSSVEWKTQTMEIGVVKDEFSKLISQFENPEVINSVRQAVEKRRKKRVSQKRKKAQRRECLAKVHEDRRRMHLEIDQWLENMKEDTERTKMEENMKKDADCVLAEVTKKKSEARKQLSLIQALIKLRAVRDNAATSRGEKISLEDRAAFTKITDRLLKMWEDAFKVYSKEEQGLRVMLEQNATEDKIAATTAKERKITQEWELALFGPKCIPSPAYWGLTCAEKDLETFIAIRKSWDTFMVKENDVYGSKIPIGWILPDADANTNWTKYLSVE